MVVNAETTPENGLNILSPIFLFLSNMPAEAYLELSRRSTMELFCEDSYLFSQKISIVDVLLGSKHTSGWDIIMG